MATDKPTFVCPRCWQTVSHVVRLGRFTFCGSCIRGWEALTGQKTADIPPEELVAHHVPPVATDTRTEPTPLMADTAASKPRDTQARKDVDE